MQTYFQCGFSLKPTLCSLLSQKGYIEAGNIIFRQYNPLSDEIVNKFSPQEWSLIYRNVDEQRLRVWNSIALDRVLLISQGIKDGNAFGFICIHEMKEKLGTILIHGGIWEHSIFHMIQLFKGQCAIIKLLLDFGFSIEATCLLSNKRADRMQKSIGFVEYKQEDELSYKKLDIVNFSNNIFKDL